MRVIKEIVDRDFIDVRENNPDFVFDYLSIHNHLYDISYKKCHFIINDIFMPIAPLSINIQKDHFNWGYKTLRTKTTTKLASGRSQILVQLKLLFSSEMILMLHRLIIQIRNNPFVYISNNYISESIRNSTGYFTVVGFRISSYQPSNASFEVELDLKVFNHKPYGTDLFYRYELESLYTKEVKENKTLYKSITFSVFANKILNDKLDYSPLTLNYELVADPQTATIDTKNQDLNLAMFQNFKKYADMTWEKDPYLSNVYVRYYNYLQIKSLNENFGIQLNRLEANAAQNYLTNIEMDLIESGAVSGMSRITPGLHSSIVSYDSKKKIIEEMLSHDKAIGIYYNEYESITLSAQALKNYRKEIMHGTEGLTGQERDKKIFENNQRILKALEEGKK